MAAKRNIFVEVDSRDAVEKPSPAGMAGWTWQSRKAIARWLCVLLAGVVLTIVVGGATRLMDAGLAITEWQPASGALPPLSEADWESEFEKYKQIPEFTLQNSEMTLDSFKRIYWLEWGHRQLGRALGLIWLTGFLWFALRRRLRPGWTSKLLVLGVLGGLQGAIGWWMVSSGLSGTAVDVASYRLAIHLLIAFIISGLVLWYILQLGHEPADLFAARRVRDRRLRGFGAVAIGVLGVQIVLGALVSGIDAGTAFPTWPLMNGSFFPADSLVLEPVMANFIENPGLVQFNHRLVAYLILIGAAALWWKGRASQHRAVRRAAHLLFAMVLIQAVIGIATALSAADPSHALLHQAGSIILFLLAVNFTFQASYPQRSPVS